FDAQQDTPAAGAGRQPGDQVGAGVADVLSAGRRRGQPPPHQGWAVVHHLACVVLRTNASIAAAAGSSGWVALVTMLMCDRPFTHIRSPIQPASFSARSNSSAISGRLVRSLSAWRIRKGGNPL